jgi:hypothetical protein
MRIKAKIRLSVDEAGDGVPNLEVKFKFSLDLMLRTTALGNSKPQTLHIQTYRCTVKQNTRV